MFRLVNKNGVFLMKSTVLKSRHGFSTRIGGFSELDYTRGLNLAFGRGDDEETVIKNMELFAGALGVDPRKIISVPQIHSNFVRTVTNEHSGEGVFKKHTLECDGYVTEEDDLPIAIKTADCVPILLEARNDGGEVIAVSAIHAGWRGTADKIAEASVTRLMSMGADARNIYVAIGPSVDECCYEVGSDFSNTIREKLGQNYENKFIKRKENGSLFADIRGMNIEILLSLGVPVNNIDVCESCTCCDTNLFYSHRGQKGKRGAMMNLICK